MQLMENTDACKSVNSIFKQGGVGLLRWIGCILYYVISLAGSRSRAGQYFLGQYYLFELASLIIIIIINISSIVNLRKFDCLWHDKMPCHHYVATEM